MHVSLFEYEEKTGGGGFTTLSLIPRVVTCGITTATHSKDKGARTKKKRLHTKIFKTERCLGVREMRVPKRGSLLAHNISGRLGVMRMMGSDDK